MDLNELAPSLSSDLITVVDIFLLVSEASGGGREVRKREGGKGRKKVKVGRREAGREGWRERTEGGRKEGERGRGRMKEEREREGEKEQEKEERAGKERQKQNQL